MYSAVKPLRKNGSRMPDREIRSMEPVVGELRLIRIGTDLQLWLYEPGNNQFVRSILPVLHDARCISMHGGAMLWEGLEHFRDESIKPVVQEWSVRVGSFKTHL